MDVWTLSAANFSRTASILEFLKLFWKVFVNFGKLHFLVAIIGTFLIHFYHLGNFFVIYTSTHFLRQFVELQNWAALDFNIISCLQYTYCTVQIHCTTEQGIFSLTSVSDLMTTFPSVLVHSDLVINTSRILCSCPLFCTSTPH